MLQLRADGMTERAIALAQGVSRKSVLAVFDAADKAGIGSDGHVGRNGAEVYALLFPGRGEHERGQCPLLPESRPCICMRDSAGLAALSSAVAARRDDSDLFIRRGEVDTEKRAEVLVTHRPLLAKLFFTQAGANARSGLHQKTRSARLASLTHQLASPS